LQLALNIVGVGHAAPVRRILDVADESAPKEKKKARDLQAVALLRHRFTPFRVTLVTAWLPTVQKLGRQDNLALLKGRKRRADTWPTQRLLPSSSPWICPRDRLGRYCIVAKGGSPATGVKNPSLKQDGAIR
jgi:hypothetical protein